MCASDHIPIRICFALERADPTRGRFFIDKRIGLEEVIKDYWRSRYELQKNIMDMINRCRRWVLRWKKHADLNSRNKITRLKTALEQRVTHTMNELLMAYISEDEIKRAAFSVKGSSAPREDGLT
ncbi:hypothetical protein YC2023_010486 [Brassica napus]